jgi:hypothetical protein
MTNNIYRNYRNIAFPESFYPPIGQTWEYSARIEAGADIASQTTVTIVALVRNAGNYFTKFISRVKAIGELFQNYQVFLYENDSHDFTPALITQNQLEIKNYSYLCEKLNKPRHPNDTSQERTVDMAYYRNQYLRYIREKAERTTYVLILDSDLHGGYSYEGILHSLSLDYDIVTSNGLLYLDGKRHFYDTWAYRRLGHPEPHISAEINELFLHRNEEPVKILSGFGGMAIYKRHCFDNSFQYQAGDCDHPTLHKQLPYEVWLNPSQITLYSQTYYNG